MKRTTILANDDLYLEAKRLAERDRKTFTQLVHEALAEYVAARRRPRTLSIVGIGHGPGNVAERVDEILRSEIDPREGWSRQGSWQPKSKIAEAQSRTP